MNSGHPTPTSLLHGWQMQAAQFTPDLRLVVLHGTDRSALRKEALRADLVVTTYPLLARDQDWLTATNWPLVILDEAQTLKNPASQMAKSLRNIPAKGRLALTGTPLENSLQDLWTLIDWVNPGLLGDRKGFQKLFRTPIEKHGDAAAQSRLNRMRCLRPIEIFGAHMLTGIWQSRARARQGVPDELVCEDVSAA
jgi:SNF2 family DNA or RNA helicase